MGFILFLSIFKLSKTESSLIFFRILQFIIKRKGNFIIRVCIFMPFCKILIMVHDVFQSSERIADAFLLCIRKHQVHAIGKGILILIISNDMECIFHQAPYNVPFLLRNDISLYPESQYLLQLRRIHPVDKKKNHHDAHNHLL